EGKRTLMVIHALRHTNGSDHRRLSEFFGRSRTERSADDVTWVRGVLDRTGALEHARIVARALGGAALYEFDKYFSDLREGRDRTFIRNLLVWVLQRSH